jgi:hypothetical protein
VDARLPRFAPERYGGRECVRPSSSLPRLRQFSRLERRSDKPRPCRRRRRRNSALLTAASCRGPRSFVGLGAARGYGRPMGAGVGRGDGTVHGDGTGYIGAGIAGAAGTDHGVGTAGDGIAAGDGTGIGVGATVGDRMNLDPQIRKSAIAAKAAIALAIALVTASNLPAANAASPEQNLTPLIQSVQGYYYGDRSYWGYYGGYRAPACPYRYHYECRYVGQGLRQCACWPDIGLYPWGY